MSAEPETRHFTTEELARFLDQLAFDRPLARAERLAKGADLKPASIPLLQSDPATMLGTGHLVPVGAPQLRLHARPRGDVALRAPLGDHQADVPERGTRVAGRRLSWRRFVAIPLLLLIGWLGCSLCAPAKPSVAPEARRSLPALPIASHPTRPPPQDQVTPERSSMRVAVSPPAAQSPTPTEGALPAGAPTPTVQSLTPTASARPTAAPSTRETSATAGRPGALARRPESRRQAVDLLLSGHTRAALDAYRALQLAARDEPALAQIVRLLARELEACREQIGLPCGS